MQTGETPDVAPCENPVERNIALADSLNINGTPAIIISDGSLIPGAIAASRLEQMLNQAQRATK
jgi:thiol:disulfide interchange protein DsbC